MPAAAVGAAADRAAVRAAAISTWQCCTAETFYRLMPGKHDVNCTRVMNCKLSTDGTLKEK